MAFKEFYAKNLQSPPANSYKIDYNREFIKPGLAKMQNSFHPISLAENFSKALVYCMQLHAGQRRKVTSTPYIAHLLSVSALVLKVGGGVSEAIAALLHDALEDQPDKTSPEEIRQYFGDQVLVLILACTDTPVDYQGGIKPEWRTRKETYLRHLREGADGALRIALADKLDNAVDLLACYRQKGEDLWHYFNAGKEDQLWFYRSLVTAFKEGGAQGFMFEEFERVVAELEQLTRAAPAVIIKSSPESGELK